jgi:hypothetical protein
MQGLKKKLISLQKEVASCLHKLELGWDNKEKGTQLDQGMVGIGLKNREHKEDEQYLMDEPKPIRKQPIIKFYCKTYVY